MNLHGSSALLAGLFAVVLLAAAAPLGAAAAPAPADLKGYKFNVDFIKSGKTISGTLYFSDTQLSVGGGLGIPPLPYTFKAGKKSTTFEATGPDGSGGKVVIKGTFGAEGITGSIIKTPTQGDSLVLNYTGVKTAPAAPAKK